MPDVAHHGLSVFEKAMEETDDEIVYSRLEREKIGCYAVLVDPATEPAYG